MSWHNEYERHALSAMGIKTGQKYKILAVIPQQNNKMVKFLNSKKEDYETNLKTLQKGGAQIAYAGLSDDPTDIEQYNKFAKPNKYVSLAGKKLVGLDSQIVDIIPPNADNAYWNVDVSLLDSLGEHGYYHSFMFDEEPTLGGIKSLVKAHLKSEKKEFNNSIISGEEENQLKAIRKLNLK